jgi:hypothetical protein
MEPEKKTRSGSETRQKQYRLVIRLADDERAELEAAAQRSGLTLASYARGRMLRSPRTEARQRPTQDQQTLQHALITAHGQLSKMGSNLAQLLKRVNFGETPHGIEVKAAAADCRAALATILALREEKNP